MKNNNMYEIRFHGRGGQGVVTAAALLAKAVYYNKKYVLAFPRFGVERRGAPVEAYLRVSSEPILLRSQIYSPNALIILDHSLIEDIDIFYGTDKDTLVLVNSELSPSMIKGVPKGIKLHTVPATKLAMQHIGREVLNTVLLGAFAKVNDLTNKQSISKAIKERFSGELAQKNIKAMEEAFKGVVSA